jgi:hypothetical protein
MKWNQSWPSPLPTGLGNSVTKMTLLQQDNAPVFAVVNLRSRFIGDLPSDTILFLSLVYFTLQFAILEKTESTSTGTFSLAHSRGRLRYTGAA